MAEGLVYYPLVPYLVSKVPTKEASYFLRHLILAVEEAAWGEVVELFTPHELLIRDYSFFWVALKITKMLEEVLSSNVFRRHWATDSSSGSGSASDSGTST